MAQSDCVSDSVPNTIWTGYLKPLNVNGQDLRSGKGGVDKGRGVAAGMSIKTLLRPAHCQKGQEQKINTSQSLVKENIQWRLASLRNLNSKHYQTTLGLLYMCLLMFDKLNAYLRIVKSSKNLTSSLTGFCVIQLLVITEILSNIIIIVVVFTWIQLVRLVSHTNYDRIRLGTRWCMIGLLTWAQLPKSLLTLNEMIVSRPIGLTIRYNDNNNCYVPIKAFFRSSSPG